MISAVLHDAVFLFIQLLECAIPSPPLLCHASKNSDSDISETKRATSWWQNQRNFLEMFLIFWGFFLGFRPKICVSFLYVCNMSFENPVRLHCHYLHKYEMRLSPIKNAIF